MSGVSAGATHRAWLWQYLRPRRRAIAMVMLLALLATSFSVLTPLITRHIIDDGLIGRDETSLLFWVAVMLLLTLASAITGAINRRLYVGVSSQMLMAMRRDTFAHLSTLSPAFHLRFGQGNMLARLDADLSEVQRYALDSLLAGSNGLLGLIGALVIMFLLSPKLLLITFVLMPVSIIFLKIMRPQLETNTRALRERATDVSTLMIDRLPNIRLLQAFLAVGDTMSRLDDRQSRFRHQLLSNQMLGYWVATVPGLFNSLATAAVFIVGGYAVIAGNLTLGVLIAFASYLGRATGPVNSFMGLYVATQRARVSLERLHEILDVNPAVAEPRMPIKLPSGEGELLLSEVVFAHPGQAALWSPLSLTIPAGARVWVQAPSGTGKSTLLSLLQRHADPLSGVIRIDGAALPDLSLTDLRQAICGLDQDAPMLDASVRDNLCLGISYDDTRLSEALGRAGLGAWLESLPDGLNTSLGLRGARVSGGERHRLALARVFLRTPRVVLLDETTAALDDSLAMQIWQSVSDLFVGQTLLIASHQRPELADLSHHLVLTNGRWAFREL